MIIPLAGGCGAFSEVGELQGADAVSVATDGRDEGTGLSFCAYMGCLLWPSVSGRAGHLIK
jgi:hypothetical protein